jgi:hypothetical protein
MNRTIYLHFKKAIKQYLRARRKEEEKLAKKKTWPHLMWTETDVQSYLYHRLVSNFSDYVIINRPVLSKIRRVRQYNRKATSVKPFYQPDFLITRQGKGNLKVERRKDKPHAEQRLALKRKDDAIVVEVKFAQDTNDATGRKTKSKLARLRDDYRKNAQQGHKWIILVLVEKGEKSYLTNEDIKQMHQYKDALVIQAPEASEFQAEPLDLTDDI